MNLTVEQLKQVERPKLTVPGIRYDVVTPRDYQIIDAAFIIMGRRVVLGEWAAAGKKLITLLAAGKLFDLGRANNVLVLSLGDDCVQWIEEIEKFTDFSSQLYRGSVPERRRMVGSDVDFRVTTYNTAANDLANLVTNHDIVILDEVSILRTPDTNLHQHTRALCAPTPDEIAVLLMQIHSLKERKRYESQRKDKNRSRQPFIPRDFTLPHLRQPAGYVWGLTATPMETGPLNLFSLFHVIQGSGSCLGTDPALFKETYCNVKHYQVWSPNPVYTREGLRRVRIWVEKVTGLNRDNAESLRDRMREHYIRHPWNVIEPYLPSLQVLKIPLTLGKRQVDRYKEISDGRVILDYVRADTGNEISEREVSYAIKLFYQLRCCDGLNSLPNQRYTDSVKLQWTMEMLNGELGGEKVVIYSRYHQPLNDLEARLNLDEIGFARIDGVRSDEENTEARLKFWDDPNCLVLLITDKGARGLNLHIARYGIAYNRPFNPKFISEQLHGRIRRSDTHDGSHHTVTWYHLVCEDTVEEAQWEILESREQDAIELELGAGDENIFAALDPNEQAALVNFGLGAYTG